MTEAEYIAADIVLLAIPSNVAFSFYGFMGGNHSVGIHDKYSTEIVAELQQIFMSRSGVARTFLLNEKYIEVVNYAIPHDVLTDKGKKAQELGGHKQYKEWEAAEIKRKQEEADRKEKELKKLNWPQKYWWVILILSAIIFPLGTGLLLKERKKRPNPEPQPIQVVRDTIYIFRPDSSKENISRKDTAKKGG